MTAQYQLALSWVQSRGSAEDWFNLGVVLEGMRRWGACAGAFARAAQLRPEDHRAWCAAGWAMHRTGRHGEGADWLAMAIRLRPDDGLPHALLAQVLVTLEREGEALELGRRAVELSPGFDKLHLGYSFALSAVGRWLEAWEQYEHRFEKEIPEFRSRTQFFPLWRGERVDHLFIECEQGLGDTIFGLRWVYEAARRVPEVVLYVQKELWALVRSAAGLPANVSVYPMPRALPRADAWCPMLSLPVALDAAEYFDPGVTPYIRAVSRAEAEFVENTQIDWSQASLVAPGQGRDYSRFPLRVGLCWSGNPNHELAHWRDVPLAYLLPLAEIAGTEWHSLQVGPGAAQLGDLGAYGLIVDRGPEMTNFLDTAQIIAGLDLVVTVDTAVAHLAGAMGVPCWVMINDRGSDFRWGRRATETPWYRSWRLWRRGLGEDWAALVERVGAGLRELVG